MDGPYMGTWDWRPDGRLTGRRTDGSEVNENTP
jgi:hypothetical protein